MALLLEHEWTAWYDHSTPGRNSKDYEKGLFTICTIKSVQDFWGCFNNLPSLATLENKCGFHFMKKGVKPAWEDSANAKGGIWKFKIGKNEVQDMWREILMSLVGDSYVDELKSEINGLSVSFKQGEFVITLWFKDECFGLDLKTYLSTLMTSPKTLSDPSYLSCKTLVNNISS
jgi:translation initiation factor 4E